MYIYIYTNMCVNICKYTYIYFSLVSILALLAHFPVSHYIYILYAYTYIYIHIYTYTAKLSHSHTCIYIYFIKTHAHKRYWAHEIHVGSF